MSKEEIIDRHHNLNLGLLSITEPQIHAAMDEYAKQVAIGFAEWANSESNGWFIVNPQEGIWGSTVSQEIKTSAELYELYTKTLF